MTQGFPRVAIILAAGRGTRMLAETDERPKALVPLLGRPLIDWQCDALRQAGVQRIVIVGGYCHSMLDGYGDEFLINEQWNKTNMVASLSCADAVLREVACIVAYSDIAYGPSTVAALAEADTEIAIIYDRRWLELWSLRFNDPLSDAETFRSQDRRLLEIGDRAKDVGAIEGQYVGLLRIEPSGWQAIITLLENLPESRRRTLDMTTLLKLLMCEGVEIGVIPIDGKWCEIDRPRDRDLYESEIQIAKMKGRTWSHDWREYSPNEKEQWRLKE